MCIAHNRQTCKNNGRTKRDATGVLTHDGGPMNHVLVGGTYVHHLANMIENLFMAVMQAVAVITVENCYRHYY